MLFAGTGRLCLPVHVSATSLISSLRKPEVLAPAGEWDCVRAAVENGADADAVPFAGRGEDFGLAEGGEEADGGHGDRKA